MPRRKDIKKVLVIDAGPIVIGQAAEFDYAGTQACLALKEEGYEVILANSNPATIMTDTHIADKVYMEPLTLEYVAKIIRFERPDAIVPGLGGQTGLNLAVQLAKKGILKECQVEILGTSFESIERAEDRELFKELCESLGEPVLPSHIAMSIEEAVAVAEEIGYPVVLRPAFTLGGTGGGFADDETELREMMRNALSLSPVHQVLVEKSIKGYKEIEYEVMRDRNDTAICICCMENIDPVGIHTGDSIVVAPSQTLTNKEFQMLRDSALKIIRELKIEGGCNVQFALDPLSFKYYLIEVNPRVSRSSALASKASGYPIARVSAKIAVGLTLDEIRIANTPASFEPTLDYIVTKVARFPFDKFSDASNKLGTQMKATGEVMSIGRTMEESLLKAVRSLETGVCHIYHKKFDKWSNDDLLAYLVMKEAASTHILAGTVKDAGMSGLFGYKGTHKVKFVVTDTKGRTSYTNLTVKVTEGGSVGTGPEVKWTNKAGTVSYDFGTRYKITKLSDSEADPEVKITVTSQTGIVGFSVDINSTTLTPEELQGLGLSTHMDLVNPGSFEGPLTNLGFPTGSAVAGKKSLTFDISSFMPMLTVLGPGNSDFKLTVIDASGSVSKTIQLYVP